MWRVINATICIVYSCMLLQCAGIRLIDLQEQFYKGITKHKPALRVASNVTSISKPVLIVNDERRSYHGDFDGMHSGNGDDEETGIKAKMCGLVKKTVTDVEEKLKSIKEIKTKLKTQPAYKVGFMLSLIKKAKEAIKDLYNVAVKHKDNWKALKELKMFELIAHTNVDLSHLIRQMVEEHVRYLSGGTTKDAAQAATTKIPDLPSESKSTDASPDAAFPSTAKDRFIK